MEKETFRIYQDMYYHLFRNISKALTFLAKGDTASVDDAIKTLQNAQCKTEEIYTNKEYTSSGDNLYENIYKRVNLQSIGYFIKEGSNLKKKNCSSFSQREYFAEKELEEELLQLLDEKTMKDVYPSIIKYTSSKEEIQFSLGMKIGAKIALLLTSDSEYDF